MAEFYIDTSNFNLYNYIDISNFNISNFIDISNFNLHTHNDMKKNKNTKNKNKRNRCKAKKIILVKSYFKKHVVEELMQKVFHPKNINKFESWGFSLDA
jgi:predicted O-linked N-acetylglucosamine transferase (SPINDLY family)